jgi:putative transposase
MPHRVSPTEPVRGHIDELFASGKSLPEILEDVARLLMQAALEAEITEFLHLDRYQRAAACEDARPGSRNGYREVTVKTTAGPVQLSRPKLRGQLADRDRQPAPRRRRCGVSACGGAERDLGVAW